MTSALILLALTALTVAVVLQLRANHRRVTAWPAGDEPSDRDAARLRTDLVAAGSATASGASRPRVVRSAPSGRRVAPPSVRAA